MTSIVSLKKGSWSIDHTPSLAAKSMFFYVQSAGYFKCKPNYITSRQNYNTFLIVYTLEGRGVLHYRSQTYILEKGQGFLIDCMDYQYYGVYKSGSWNFKWFHFNGCESKNYFERIYDNSGPIFNINSDSIIPDHIDKISRMMKQRDHKIDIMNSCKIVNILTELLLGSYEACKYGAGTPAIIEEAIQLLERDFNQDINLDSISRQIGISKYHFSRLFKRYTGYSPYEYILNYRLSQSKSLLKSTELPIYEIAYKVGFNSSSHFIKQFRKQEGITPLKFREYWR